MPVGVGISVFCGRDTGVIFKKFDKVVFAFKGKLLCNLVYGIQRCMQQGLRMRDFLFGEIFPEQDSIGVFKNSADVVFVITKMLCKSLDGQIFFGMEQDIFLNLCGEIVPDGRGGLAL